MVISWLERPTDSGTPPIPQSEAFISLSLPEPKPEGKNPHAVALGRLGGLKGGKARAKKMTPEQRKEIARKAAKARWLSHNPQ